MEPLTGYEKSCVYMAIERHLETLQQRFREDGELRAQADVDDYTALLAACDKLFGYAPKPHQTVLTAITAQGRAEPAPSGSANSNR